MKKFKRWDPREDNKRNYPSNNKHFANKTFKKEFRKPDYLLFKVYQKLLLSSFLKTCEKNPGNSKKAFNKYFVKRPSFDLRKNVFNPYKKVNYSFLKAYNPKLFYKYKKAVYKRFKKNQPKKKIRRILKKVIKVKKKPITMKYKKPNADYYNRKAKKNIKKPGKILKLKKKRKIVGKKLIKKRKKVIKKFKKTTKVKKTKPKATKKRKICNLKKTLYSFKKKPKANKNFKLFKARNKNAIKRNTIKVIIGKNKRIYHRRQYKREQFFVYKNFGVYSQKRVGLHFLRFLKKGRKYLRKKMRKKKSSLYNLYRKRYKRFSLRYKKGKSHIIKKLSIATRKLLPFANRKYTLPEQQQRVKWRAFGYRKLSVKKFKKIVKKVIKLRKVQETKKLNENTRRINKAKKRILFKNSAKGKSILFKTRNILTIRLKKYIYRDNIKQQKNQKEIEKKKNAKNLKRFIKFLKGKNFNKSTRKRIIKKYKIAKKRRERQFLVENRKEKKHGLIDKKELIINHKNQLTNLKNNKNIVSSKYLLAILRRKKQKVLQLNLRYTKFKWYLRKYKKNHYYRLSGQRVLFNRTIRNKNTVNKIKEIESIVKEYINLNKTKNSKMYKVLKKLKRNTLFNIPEKKNYLNSLIPKLPHLYYIFEICAFKHERNQKAKPKVSKIIPIILKPKKKINKIKKTFKKFFAFIKARNRKYKLRLKRGAKIAQKRTKKFNNHVLTPLILIPFLMSCKFETGEKIIKKHQNQKLKGYLIATRKDFAIYNVVTILLNLRITLKTMISRMLVKVRTIINYAGNKKIGNMDYKPIEQFPRKEFLVTWKTWTGGTLTNFKRISKRIISRIKNKKYSPITKPIYIHYPKNIPKIPGFMLSASNNHWALNESKKVRVKSTQLIENSHLGYLGDINLPINTTYFSLRALTTLFVETAAYVNTFRKLRHRRVNHKKLQL